jgi:hypothetical protein
VLRSPLFFVAPLVCAALAGCARPPPPKTTLRETPITNVPAARELDQQGVRAFREGRYNDAAMYFRESFRLGGPPSELWNVGRALERLDDAEGAARAFESYVTQEKISPDERAEAQREVAALRSRTSVVTIVGHPNGTTVSVDGQRGGQTPLTLDLPPGPHTLTFTHEGFVSQTLSIEARFGRAILVEATLAPVPVVKGQP